MVPIRPGSERTPRLRHYYPEWWHHHGERVVVNEVSQDELALSSPVAHLSISYYNEKYWLVKWYIKHFGQTDKVEGQTLFTTAQLEAAFGLTAMTGEPGFSDWLIERYGGTSAYQGCYILWRDHLNVPGPGTGHDGDSNISLLVTPAIKNEVGGLIVRGQERAAREQKE